MTDTTRNSGPGRATAPAEPGKTPAETAAATTTTLLRRVARQFDGIVPNVYRTLSQAPAALHTFVEAEHALETSGLLSPRDQACVALEVSVAAGCHYCRSVFVLEARHHGLDEAAIAAITGGTLPRDPQARMIVEATRQIMARHGALGEAEIAAFGRRGLTRAAMVEIVALIGAYTVATYANNLSRTRIDPEYRLDGDGDDDARTGPAGG